jgi:hypothetical protein
MQTFPNYFIIGPSALLLDEMSQRNTYIISIVGESVQFWTGSESDLRWAAMDPDPAK